VNPNRIHIICGHIDDASEIPETFAPGSDDNASGAGLVLDAARMFQGIEFDYTVWFIGFGAEEFGLVGSDTFARECRNRGDTIVLTINHDMDSYGMAGRDSIRVVGKRSNPPCSTWVEYYMAMADTFTDLKCHREIVDEQSSSDQASFWKYGYTAIRDRYLDIDPVYHTTGDTIGPYQYQWCGTNNIPMYTEAIKATVATIARLAGAHAETTGVAESRPRPTRATVSVLPSVGRAPVLVRLSSASSGVSVYSAAGRLIRRLGAGKSLAWDGRDFSGAAVSPGVYYFRAAEASARFVLAE
jgi:Zn-dependent M28 family amino/carboxypeptidase